MGGFGVASSSSWASIRLRWESASSAKRDLDRCRSERVLLEIAEWACPFLVVAQAEGRPGRARIVPFATGRPCPGGPRREGVRGRALHQRVHWTHGHGAFFICARPKKAHESPSRRRRSSASLRARRCRVRVHRPSRPGTRLTPGANFQRPGMLHKATSSDKAHESRSSLSADGGEILVSTGAEVVGPAPRS